MKKRHLLQNLDVMIAWLAVLVLGVLPLATSVWFGVLQPLLDKPDVVETAPTHPKPGKCSAVGLRQAGRRTPPLSV